MPTARDAQKQRNTIHDLGTCFDMEGVAHSLVCHGIADNVSGTISARASMSNYATQQKRPNTSTKKQNNKK